MRYADPQEAREFTHVQRQIAVDAERHWWLTRLRALVSKWEEDETGLEIPVADVMRLIKARTDV